MKLPPSLDGPPNLWERVATAILAAIVGAVTALAFCCFALLAVGAQALVGFFGLEQISSVFARVIEYTTLGSAVLAFFAPNAFIDAIGAVWDLTYGVFQRLPRD